MSYIGNEPNYQNFAVQTEDGGAASYALDYTPGTAHAILVFVDGVHQKPGTDYTVSGSTLTPVSVFPSGTGNVAIVFLGRQADIGTPSDDTVSTAKLQDGAVTHAKRTYNAGEVVQSVTATNSTYTSTTTTIAEDDTIPQNTEGVEFITATITPKKATNKLRVTTNVLCTASAALHPTQAIFQDSAADALYAQQDIIPSSNYRVRSGLVCEFVAGTTSATTIKLRVGTNGSGTLYFNGTTTARLFGGKAVSSLIVEEIAA